MYKQIIWEMYVTLKEDYGEKKEPKVQHRGINEAPSHSKESSPENESGS